MKEILMLSMVGLLALSVTGWAQVPCSAPIDVNPGETIILNGTEVPPVTDPVTTVEYSWTFLDSATNNRYNIVYNVNDTVIPQPWEGAYLNFSAPAITGCYKAYLTVWFNRTVAGSTTLEGSCVDYDCFEICVNESTCPLCDNIDCWDVAPNCTNIGTESGDRCPAYMCFENFSEGLTVWYNVTLKNGGTPVVQYNATDDDGCVCIPWTSSTFVNETYVVTMDVYGPDGVKSFDCTGNVSVVQNPVADIRREN